MRRTTDEAKTVGEPEAMLDSRALALGHLLPDDSRAVSMFLELAEKERAVVRAVIELLTSEPQKSLSGHRG